MILVLIVPMFVALAYGIYEDRRGNPVPIDRVGWAFLAVLLVVFGGSMIVG